MITTREEKAIHIALAGGVKRGSAGWWVKSQSNPRVQYWCNTERCTCPDYKERGGACNHMEAVQVHLAEVERKAAIHRQFAQDVQDIWGEEYEGG